MFDSLGIRREQRTWENRRKAWCAVDSRTASLGTEAFVQNANEAELFAAAPCGGTAKRCLDLFLTLLLLPFAAVLALPLALLIALDGGKAIYGHLRVGWNGRLFRCYKFRTMIADADASLETLLKQNPEARQQWLERYKLENDPRVTRLGWLLRETNLDEIPQIWNVIRGEMSWVGPRPVVPEELSRYGAHLPVYLACRPGVTGLWQIRRRHDMPYSKRVALDAHYVRHWSIGRDLVILFLTIPRIFVANRSP